MRPPPSGVPAHSVLASARQICRIASASRGRIIGIGPIGAAPGGAAAAGAPASGAVPPPPMAATALWHRRERLAALRCRHCNASLPPGCTPEQCAMKSDRHAARMAAFCCSVGGAAAAAGAAAGGALGRGGSTGFLIGSTRRVGSGGGGAGDTGFGSPTVGVAGAGSDCTAAWQPGESSAALAFRHSRISGLVGAIQEQCAMTSLSVHAFCTALRASSEDGQPSQPAPRALLQAVPRLPVAPPLRPAETSLRSPLPCRPPKVFRRCA
jgi:hypothetical protein